ncbi:hypothetical protein [Lysobacter humi (ex Lee et al. 2017)]
MAGLLESIIARLGSTALSAVGSYLRARFKPRRLDRPAAPRDFFEHFGPGVPQERVRELLGAPHRQLERHWGYVFKDALAQFEMDGAGVVESVALALTATSPKTGFPIPGLGIALGKLSLDHFASDIDGKFQLRESGRTWELVYQTQLPPSLTRAHYTFGTLSVLTPGELDESIFSVETARKSARLASKGVRVNWVGISRSPEELWFEWSLALPIAA